MDAKEKAEALVSQMTLEEKVSLCSGKNFWYLKSIDRLGIPEIMVTDGPHGLRKQETSANDIGLNASVPSTCFPTASAVACSFDRQMLFEMGKAIAEECRQENVAVLLGPGINIKRSPLCGRNFEYFSEDPLVSGELAAAFIDGVQSQNVGVSLKHFAANNQETRRMTIDSVMDERTFREVYLKGFEIAVKKARPWTVMCSYNSLFGEFASQNEQLLTGILREAWGFDGVVVSDWGATVDRVSALCAGLDLEMPHIDDAHNMEIIKAVRSGKLAIEKVDAAAENVVALILKSEERKSFQYKQADHHALARTLSAQSAILLKNEGNLLPGKVNASTAIIGAFAKNPRYQGTGSSKILPYKLDNPYDELIALGVKADYAEGYPMDVDDVDENIIHQACETAKGKDIVFLFAGLPDRYESEGFDRESMRMPENHIRLIESVSAVNRNVVVILLGGAPMETPWIDKVSAVLLMYLGGQAVGGAIADILTGRVNPSGKLAESWPLKLEDNPSYNYFPGYPMTVEYRESVFVGYRYYDTAQVPVRFPFGFGLSYTRFEYSDLRIEKTYVGEGDVINVSCDVRNSGSVDGKEVVQVFVSRKDSMIFRAAQELKGFQKVSLKAGEQKRVVFSIPVHELAFYNTEGSSWQVEDGDYEVRIGSSSRDIRLTGKIQVSSKNTHVIPDLRQVLPAYFDLSHGLRVTDAEFETLIGRPLPPRERMKSAPHTINSTFSDIKDKWVGRQILKFVDRQLENMSKDNADLKIMAEKMLMDSPLRLIATMGGSLTTIQLYGLVDLLNGRMIKGVIKLLKK